jgi:putative hemolysin
MLERCTLSWLIPAAMMGGLTGLGTDCWSDDTTSRTLLIPNEIWEVLIILALILANGFFAGAEIAIIAARRNRLQQLADEGDESARAALELANDPNRFLPTVQIGITLVGTFAAAFGGARLATFLSAQIAKLPSPWLAEHSGSIALGLVVVGISFFSVLLGELVPKRIALRYALALSRWVAGPMTVLGRVGRPVVWFMGVCTDAVLSVFGVRGGGEPAVSVEDIEHLIQSGTKEGLLEPAEQRLAMEALRLGERTTRDIMRPRIEVDALEVSTPWSEVLGSVAMSTYSRLPVYEGHLDHIVGFIHIRDVLRRHYLGLPAELRKIMHPVMFVPEALPVDRLLVTFQEKKTQLAVVLDEFGGTEGIVTLEDVMSELVGEIRDEHRRDEQQRIVQRDEQSWLVDGIVNIDRLVEQLGISEPEWETPRTFTTLAGLILAQLGRIPDVSDSLVWQGYRLEVVDMDGRRIDRVLVTSVPTGQGPETD